MNQPGQSFTQIKAWSPFHSPFDPCPPIGQKFYRTPVDLYMTFQPPNLEQFPPQVALKNGTLWKVFYDYYENPFRERKS